MKNTNIKLKIGALALMAGLYSTAAVAETADGVAAATVIQPLVLTATQTMFFGTVAPNSVAAGTLSMDNTGAVTSGDLDVITAAGTTLQFTIQGEAAQAYTLGIANGLLGDGGVNTMAIVITGNDAVALTGAAVTVIVTGDLSVGASQPAGNYTTAAGNGTPIVITANYN